MDAVQPLFNLIHRDAVDVLAWSAAHDTGAIVYSPMASGLLSGSFTAARAAALDDDDWRRRHPDFTGDALARNLALTDLLAPIASRYGVTVAAVAVAWTLAVPGVTGAIVGVRRADQLDAWLSAASLALDDSDLTQIAEAIERTGRVPVRRSPRTPRDARPHHDASRFAKRSARVLDVGAESSRG